jgi:hypothetical protein
MRTLNRNKQPIYYATFVSKTEATDEYGNPTGQFIVTYSAPIKTAWNARGVDSDADVQMFGIQAKDAIRVVAEKPLPIDEASIIWFGIVPPVPYTPTQPKHNFTIAGIPPTLNDGIFYAKRVDVS